MCGVRVTQTSAQVWEHLDGMDSGAPEGNTAAHSGGQRRILIAAVFFERLMRLQNASEHHRNLLAKIEEGTTAQRGVPHAAMRVARPSSLSSSRQADAPPSPPSTDAQVLAW